MGRPGRSVEPQRAYSVRPEVAGGLGSQTELNPQEHPPVVSRLHYEFAGWSGDDIAESFPCFVITQRLADAIEAADLTGIQIDDVLVTKDVQFEMFFPETASALPTWRWLRPIGAPGRDDFWVDEQAVLHVSERAHLLLRRFNVSAAEIGEVGACEP